MAMTRTLPLLVATSCLLLLLVVVVGAAPSDGGVVLPRAYPTPDSGAILIGDCARVNRLLFVDTVRMDAIWMLVRDRIVTYPKEGEIGDVIGCVELLPLKSNNKGSAIIQSGGPGQAAVAVKVKSERGHSVAWRVLLHARA